MEKIDYHNMSEEKKQELKEYQKRKYRKAKESKHAQRLKISCVLV